MARPEKWKDEYVNIASHACQLGATDQELADMLGVSVRTIYNWRASKPEFAEALKSGKDSADERVERSLYQRAIGYEQDEVKIFMPGGASEPVYAPFRAKVAPDVTAAIFWLKNRRSQEWRDKREHELTGRDGGPIEIDQKVKEDADAVAGALARLAERARAGGVAEPTHH